MYRLVQSMAIISLFRKESSSMVEDVDVSDALLKC